MKHITGTLIYKRITLVLIVCTVTILCFKISLNPSSVKMAYTVDYRNRKWPHFQGNITHEHSAGRTDHMRNLEAFVNKRLNMQNTTRPSDTETTAATTTIDIRHILNPFKVIERNLRTNPKSVTVSENKKSNKYSKSFITHAPVLNSTRINSTKKHVNFMHPNENDMEKIASGKYKLEDLMTVGPFRFLKNYKNPCWIPAERNRTTPVIRCLPYFYLIGAPKSGTTDLHRRLIQHPDVSNLVVKEPHWLTRKRVYSLGGRKTQSTLEDYLKYFAYASRELYMKRDSSRYHSKIFGDCSASTMWDNDYWTVIPELRNLSEPRYTNADYIHHLNPKTKIIAMLRNPVDRLYSDYLFFQHGSPELFHKGVVKAMNATHECLKLNSLRHCLYTPPKHDTNIKVRPRIGVYHLHLKEYFRVFPREQVMVIKLEDFSKKTAPYIQKIFAFLELPEVGMEALQRIADPEKHANPRRKKDKKAGEMLQETRELLKEFYRPHNELLTELLGEQFNYNRDSLS